MPTLSIQDRVAGSQHALRVAGEIDMATAPELDAVVNRLVPDANKLVLDLSRLSFMDSAGIYLILRSRELCQGSRCGFAVSSITPQVKRLFDLVGLTDRNMVSTPA